MLASRTACGFALSCRRPSVSAALNDFRFSYLEGCIAGLLARALGHFCAIVPVPVFRKLGCVMSLASRKSIWERSEHVSKVDVSRFQYRRARAENQSFLPHAEPSRPLRIVTRSCLARRRPTRAVSITLRPRPRHTTHPALPTDHHSLSHVHHTFRTTINLLVHS